MEGNRVGPGASNGSLEFEARMFGLGGAEGISTAPSLGSGTRSAEEGSCDRSGEACRLGICLTSW